MKQALCSTKISLRLAKEGESLSEFHSSIGGMNFDEVSVSCQNTWCPLNQIRAGTSVRIKQLRASHDLIQRLREIGLCEEQIIKPIISQANIICQVCNVRLAISVQLAQMILVEPVAHKAG